MFRRCQRICLAFAAATVTLHGAAAAELKILSSNAIAMVLEKVGSEFERSTGNKLNVEPGLSPDFVRRANAGEAFDVIATPPAAIEALIKGGKALPDGRTKLVRLANGVEVRAGAARPAIGTTAAFKDTLLKAKSIAYLPTGGIPELIERLGLTEALKAKVTIPNRDIVSELVAKGEVELGIVVITQIVTTPGVELVGPLPPDIQIYTPMEGAVSANSTAKDAAHALLQFLTGPTAIPVIKALGMEPG
jgi:molybdate transport system substrate-binding protein